MTAELPFHANFFHMQAKYMDKTSETCSPIAGVFYCQFRLLSS